MSLLSRLPMVRDHEHLLATVRRMISNQVNDVYSRHMRACRDVRRERSVAEHDSDAEQIANTATPPLGAAARSESVDQLRVILDLLHPKYRRVVEATLAGQSPAQVAAAIGESVDVVRMRLARAIKEVQRAWRRRFPDERLPELGS